MSVPASDAVEPERSTPFWIWPGLFVAAGVSAACINLGTLHDSQIADSLLLGLISTQRWTPFYWFQDRYGMLVPLLAMPVQSPLANLLFQGWMMTTAALLAPFVAARWLCGRGEVWVAAGGLANLLFLLVAIPYLQFEWLVSQPYALALALGFGGLLASERARGLAGRAAALLLMLLAHWVNVSAAIVLAPALLLRGGTRADAAVLALGVAGGIGVSRLVSAPPTVTALIPLADWPLACLTMLLSLWSWLAHTWVLGLVLAGLLLAALVLESERRARLARVTAAAVLSALLHGLACSTSEWVRLNLYFPRYVLPSVFMLELAAAIVLVAPLRRHARTVGAGAWLALYALAFASYGRPSLAGVRRSLDRRQGGMTAEIVSSGATLVAGDYWAVWPAVFHANLTLHGSGAEPVLGLTYRSSATHDLWLGRAGPILVATPPGDASAAGLAEAVGLRLELVEHRSTIDLFRALPRSAAAPAP